MTADIGTMNDLAAHSLDLVSRELNGTLDAARRELEDYVDGQAGREALIRAADLLHLAHGALKMIEVHGAGMLADEMEQSCRYVARLREQDQVDSGMEALTRAMVQLPAYLDRVMSGGRDVALVLLPLLNDLRQVRGTPMLSEGSLLLLNAGPYERHIAARPPTQVDTESSRRFQGKARNLRPAFQTALLHWIKGDDPGQNLDKLIQVSSALEQAASTEPVQQLWYVLTGVLIALRAEDLEATVSLKRLIGQADRQLKRLIDGGEAAWIHAPPVELLNSLLYYVARAGGDHERLAAIREMYGLQDVVPAEDQLAEAREGLAGPSVKLMRTVAKAIKEDLGSVKDVLDIFVRTGMEDIEQLKPQLDRLKKISDTLGVLGLEKARGQIQREARELTAIVGSHKISDQGVLEKMAATLLDVEDALDRELIRAVMPGADAEATAAETDTEAQYRHVTQAVMGECIVNLAKVKEAVTQLIEAPGDGRALDQVKPQLRGITAGLLMLNKTKAVKVVERIGAVIANRLGAGHRALKPEHLERLGDAVVSVEYYMETVSLGRSDPWYMLENAGRCLELLETLPPSKTSTSASQSTQLNRPKKVAKSPPSVMEVDEERSDPELLELFIEEAKEEIAGIARFLPAWAERPEDSEALIAVRRSFHTLKGSGRMVGAQLVGEFSWSIENLLNRLINQTLNPTPAMIEFITEAAEALPQFVEQLEIGIAPRVDVQLLMKRAEAFAEGDPEAESLTSESLRLPVPDAPAPAPDEAAAGSGMDPVLSEIYVKETLGHLEVIRAYVAACRPAKEPYAVDEPLYRACHTLLGSAKMAAFAAAVAIARPLAEHLGRHFEAGSGLSADGLAALAAAANEIARMTDALAAGTSFTEDLDLVARLQQLADEGVGSDERSGSTDGAASEPEAFVNFDPEIAAIFTEEASELLENAEVALQRMQRDGASSAALIELQRLLHTLKGGARMAGIAPMGDLSHALETLLSGMADQRIDPTSAALDVIQQCIDQLHQMRDLIESGSAVRDATALVRRIEAFSQPQPQPEPELSSQPHTLPAAPESGMQAVAAQADDHPVDEASLDEPRGLEQEGEESTVEQPVLASDAPIALEELVSQDAGIAGDRVADEMYVGSDIGEIEIIEDHGEVEVTEDIGEIEIADDGEIEVGEDAHELEVIDGLEDAHELEDDDGLEVVDDLQVVEALGDDGSADADNPSIVGLEDIEDLYGQTDPNLPATLDDGLLSSIEGAVAGDGAFDEIELAADGNDELAFEGSALDEPTFGESAFDEIPIDETSADDSLAGESLPDEQITGEPGFDVSAFEEPAFEDAALLDAANEPALDIEFPTEPRDFEDESRAVSAAAEGTGQGEDSRSEPPARVPASTELRTAERAETARVDASLLDALLNGAGEVSIFQSRLNQQVHSIDFHLGELGQTVTRLREQLRKLEAETETQILHRHQEDLTTDQGFDPLELDRYSTIQQLSRALAETANDVASINELLQALTTEADTLLTQQARVTSELQEGLMQTRMVPFQRHISRLSRIVRQAASETGKAAEFVVEGGGSEIDRQVLDSMLPPFEHLLRNAIVHGLEKPEHRLKAGKQATGQVDLKLRREGSEVLIEVGDDGAGLNLDAIRRKAYEQGLVSDPGDVSDEEAAELILRPGFSTASELTQSAGRGVGMDVVDNEVKKLGGSMRIESTPGRGTRFFIRLPYTLAVTHALIVNVGDETFALPLPTIEGITRVPRETMLDLLVQDEPKLDYGGVSYRIQHLGSLVGGTPSALPEEENAVSLVLVRAGENSTALLTDSLEGSREVVVKTMGPHLGSVSGVSGATILGDGRIIMILDAGTLVRTQRGVVQPTPVPVPVARQLTALVVDDSITMRRVTQRLLERRGVRVLTARDGLDAITVLQEHELDVILLDIEMPRMDGYQFASHVRNDSKLKSLPIIMITSRSGEKHRAKAIEIGVNDYLSKPYQEAQLVGAIEALLGRRL